MTVANLSVGLTDPRRSGSYYTSASAADLMAAWAVRKSGDRLLEPSFGDGIFIKSIAAVADAKNLSSVVVHGVELDKACHEKALAHEWGVSTLLVNDDFLATSHTPVDAVVGNPPYVRLRHLSDSRLRDRALRVAKAVLGHEMDPSGSVWMPFVLHCVRHLQAGGRLALVLPYDFTYVRYARPLWRFLAGQFSSLRVARVHERLFPDVLQEAVVLFAEGHGGNTQYVDFEAYDSVCNLISARPDASGRVSVESILVGERRFVEALLEPELQSLISDKLYGLTKPSATMATFNIGYVTGDKRFFHPTEEVVSSYGLPKESLRSALTSSRQLKRAGLHTSSVAAPQNLFLPEESQGRQLTSGERAYIRSGEDEGVDQRFKCRVREPWYRVPYVKTPDVVLSVFSSTPLLMLNDSQSAASNSLLCGYTGESLTGRQLAARWYTSLTLLECELRVHSLGGGVLIMVPGEANAIRLPSIGTASDFARIDRELKAGCVDAAYLVGDDHILTQHLGLTGQEIELIQKGAQTLRYWRERSVGAPQ